MKILRIAGKNLASLAGEFNVDFEQEPLASSGLFAICGPTGAGKSTLLDALCLALYGTTPRLPKTGSGGSRLPDASGAPVSTIDPCNLLRRGTGEGYAEVDFAGSDGQRYRARWNVRRSRNRPTGALQPVSITLHQLPELTPIGSTNTETANAIAQRVGLSFDQFTRAVLLAQNEFSAFLKTDENERGELLETLTGSTIYSALSQRAFARWRDEQEALRLMTAEHAHFVPLAPEARAALDAERAAAETTLQALDERKRALELQLAWHQTLAQLREQESQAQEQLAQATARHDAAGGDRRRLATLEAVQSARALVDEADRLAREQRQLAQALADAQGAREAAQARQQASARELDKAQQTLHDAEAAQRAAAPAIEAAKALDAALAALAPAHADAARTLEQARTRASTTTAALAQTRARRAQTEAAQRATTAWLTAQQHWQPLAAQWERWEQLLTRAAAARGAAATAAQALAQASGQLATAVRAEASGATAVQASATLLATRTRQRDEANGALAGVDLASLQDERRTLDDRREALHAARDGWQMMTEAADAAQALAQQAALARADCEAAREALAGHERAAATLGAAREQAERSLQRAEMACADNVQHLRAQLHDGDPCPVCGAAEHPYHHQDARLADLLDGLRGEVTRCRQDCADNLAAQAAARSALTHAHALLARLDADAATLAARRSALEASWNALALAPQIPDAPQRAAWFDDAQATLTEALAALQAREQAVVGAIRARDAAQQAHDTAAAAHARAQQQLGSHREQLAQAQAAHAAATLRHESAAAGLAALLAELDAPLCARDGDGWQTRWEADPAAYQQACARDAVAWQTQSARAEQLQRELAQATQQEAIAASQAAEAGQAADAATQAFARADADMAARRAERALLLDGAPAASVEQTLAQAALQARDAVATQRTAHDAAVQALVSVQASLAQDSQRRDMLAEAAAEAGARIGQWLANYHEEHPALDTIPTDDALAALLAVDHDALARLRAALAALDTGLSAAQAVLAERRTRRERHAAAPPDGLLAPDEVAAALSALTTDHAAWHGRVAALRQQVQDDEARHAQSQALLERMTAQQAREQRWARLADLIGSADGKKFRNYAQQFTLDVLLGYANRHLQQLARRYRLERVLNPAAPSLALQVRDNDMGGEIRPVNSLSGGESFLVSLALALGLASLSSNRVQVESLFIDEGFGSLDAGTLGVAMEALDALQAQGRKVGVISHVQEMTERIATRIVVRPGGSGASAITVQ